MVSSPFFRRLFLPYLLLICIATGVVGVVGATRLRASYMEQTTLALRNQSQLVAQLIDETVRRGYASAINARVKSLGGEIACRITVIASDGTVIADNEADPAHMDNHRLRPEVVAAAANGEGSSVRDSGTLHEGLLYFARRVDAPADASSTASPTYFLRVSVHLSELDRHLRTLYATIASAAVLAIAAAGALCFHFARRSSMQVVQLTRFAESLAGGDLSKRVGRTGSGEVHTLGLALNTMADSLTGLIDQAAKDNAELLAILSGMSEGVIAVDEQLKVLLVNNAAAKLLSFPADSAHGRLLWEVVRDEPILRCVADVMTGVRREPFQVGPLLGRHLEVSACPFPANKPQGLVLVVRDATESVRYQDLRKEFVANVSHELRTPLTAIKGFAETLHDGAIDDPARARQYLATIEKHADQLTNLVTDLLDLSRLDAQTGLPPSVDVEVGVIVRQAVEVLRPLAEKKRQSLQVQMPVDLPAIKGNPDYIERAVTNLLENAIKYTPDEGAIRVAVATENGTLTVQVADNGIGIPAGELPRIFERFYRVDRSRSREMGGTGLGLSIVKHVAQAHRGSVHVDSTPNVGSTFTLSLPLG